MGLASLRAGRNRHVRSETLARMPAATAASGSRARGVARRQLERGIGARSRAGRVRGPALALCPSPRDRAPAWGRLPIPVAGPRKTHDPLTSRPSRNRRAPMPLSILAFAACAAISGVLPAQGQYGELRKERALPDHRDETRSVALGDVDGDLDLVGQRVRWTRGRQGAGFGTYHGPALRTGRWRTSRRSSQSRAAKRGRFHRADPSDGSSSSARSRSASWPKMAKCSPAGAVSTYRVGLDSRTGRRQPARFSVTSRAKSPAPGARRSANCVLVFRSSPRTSRSDRPKLTQALRRSDDRQRNHGPKPRGEGEDSRQASAARPPNEFHRPHRPGPLVVGDEHGLLDLDERSGRGADRE